MNNIAIYVGGQQLDVSQREINIRLNNVVFEPEKVSTTQADYSFTFSVPSTPTNDRIFGYADNLSKPGKFRSRYACEVYCNESPIFEGSLTISAFDFREEKYECNLVSIKTNSLEEIFGDETLNNIPWEVPFDGAVTINSVNGDVATKYFFPYVVYGCPAKIPAVYDEVQNEYTSKFQIDNTNRYWIESFYPSMNIMETVRKALEWKGYKVAGTAFHDGVVSEAYSSIHLADGQVPTYNLANPKMGRVSLTCSYTSQPSAAIQQKLKYGYGKVTSIENDVATDYYNWDSVEVHDLLTRGSVTVDGFSYIYDQGEGEIVVPADGFYRITLSGSTRLVTSGTMTVGQRIKELMGIITNPQKANLRNIDITPNMSYSTPFEVQLVKNYDEDCELIHGQVQDIYLDGNQTNNGKYHSTDLDNHRVTYCCYPHEDTGYLEECYTNEELGPHLFNAQKYLPTGTFAFDPVVSDNFICGWSSIGNGQVAVRKNGSSWNKLHGEPSYVFANVTAYDVCDTNDPYKPRNEWHCETSPHNHNTYTNSTCERSYTSGGINGTIQMVVHLNRNDRLSLRLLQRYYETREGTPVRYQTTTNLRLIVEAFSPKTYSQLRAMNITPATANQFPENLNLGEFMSNETQVKEWIEGVIKAFNLEVIQDAGKFIFNTNRGVRKDLHNAVDIEDVTDASRTKASMIQYPRTMAVKYKTNTKEWGFEQSVPEEYINADDWDKHGDSGYTVLQLSDDTYNTDKQEITTDYSYTWYDTFDWYGTDWVYNNLRGWICIRTDEHASLITPVIEESEYMADGYGYEEAMAHDGYGLTQRMWFRPTGHTGCYATLASQGHEKVWMYLPINQRLGVNLSYKATEKSLLTENFNCHPMLASNYVDVESYLTADMYRQIKNGAMVWYDRDLYYVSKVTGFDPTGYNRTKIKLIKKI